ncbi:MAG: tetratricopeptide repeat protein [Bacteroidales bacterium]
MVKLKFLAYVLFLLIFPLYVTFAQGLDEKIEEYIELGEGYELNGDNNQAALYFNKVANLYWQSNKNDEAITYFEKALTNSKKIGNVNGIKVIYTNLGLIYSEKGEHKQACDYFNETLNSSRKFGKKADIATSLLNLSNEEIELGDYPSAEKNLLEIQKIAQELDNPKLLKNCYSNFNKLYEKIGNQTKAAEYFSLFAMLTKKLQSEELRANELKAKAIVDSAGRVVQQISAEKNFTDRKLAKTNQELQQKENSLREIEQITREQKMQIELLNTEMQLRDAQLNHQKLLQKVYIGLIVISLVFTSLIFYAYTEKKKANKLLREKNTEILKQTEEISEQANQLRNLNALKDKVFSIIAHDLRSPLFSLITILNIAKEGHFTEDSFKSIIEELSINVNHTTSLLENLLTWARNQMHGTKVNPVNFDLNDLVLSRLKILEDRALQKEISIVNQLNDNMFVHADKDMTEIVFRNIVSNSIKFCNAGDKVRIWSAINEGVVTVCVDDTGVGIQSDVMAKLFSTQINSSPGTRNEKGTGLGLILCKEFITMNGGEIWAESIPSKGSKFFFTLPVAKLS